MNREWRGCATGRGRSGRRVESRMADDGERDVEKEEELKLAVRGGGGMNSR